MDLAVGGGRRRGRHVRQSESPPAGGRAVRTTRGWTQDFGLGGQGGRASFWGDVTSPRTGFWGGRTKIIAKGSALHNATRQGPLPRYRRRRQTRAEGARTHPKGSVFLEREAKP